MQVQHAENHELMVLKQFMQKYGKILLITFAVLLIAFFGATYIQSSSGTRAANASQIFQEMMLAEMQHDSATATAKGEQLIADYSKTPYSQLSALLLAKMAVSEGNLDQAATKLLWVIDRSGSQKVAKNIATVRLATVYQAQGKIDEALALVEKEPDAAYTALYAQLRGDLYLAKGDIEKAKTSYELALSSLPPGTQAPITQMQLLDLGGKSNA
jgi:predicted negative regulator of RcsB-dependent stress response